MEQSILKSTKKMLGIGPDDESFDLDVITQINSAFSTLTDIGVGPTGGFVIEDDEPEWSAYLEGAPADPNDPDHKIKLSKIKTFVATHTRLRFDPPTSAYLLNAAQETIQEDLWRLSVNREATSWTDPTISGGFGLVGFGLGGFGL